MAKVTGVGRVKPNWNVPILPADCALSNKAFAQGVYLLCGAMVNRAKFEASRGHPGAIEFLNDWRDYFGSRGRVTHQEFSEF